MKIIVIAHKQDNGIFIPFEYLKDIVNKDFTEIQLEILILSFKHNKVSKTSGLLKDYNIDGVEFDNKVREEWQNTY